MVYGGSKYKQELAKCKKLRGVFVELKNKGKYIEINCAKVDEDEKCVAGLINSDKCDDAHLIAILRVSGCLLLCSNDKRADCFIKKRSLYPDRKKRSIYRCEQHETLLTKSKIIVPRNIA